jgi:hypothetical protein
MNSTTPAICVAALIALVPLAGAAQTPTGDSVSPVNAVKAVTPVTPAQPAPPPTPAQYLGEAAKVFGNISQASLKKDGQERVTALRKHFAELVSSYKANGDPYLPPGVEQASDLQDTKPDTRKDAKSNPVNWKIAFSEVESDLAGILGGGYSPLPVVTAGAVQGVVTATGTAVQGTTGVIAVPGTTRTTTVATDAATGAPVAVDQATGAPIQPGTAAVVTPAPAGTVQNPVAQPAGINAGILMGAIGVENLDPEVRRQLEQFRLNLELFFDSASTGTEGNR